MRLTILLLILTGMGQRSDMTVLEIAQRRNVLVETDGGSGSGVIYKPGLIVTNFHILETDSDVKVNGKDAKILAVDPKHDLVLLEAATLPVPELKFNLEPKVWMPVFYCGNPGNHRGLVSPGFILDIKEFLYTNTIPMGGMSGGGLYDEQGRLLGINEGMEGGKGGFHIAVHIKAVVVKAFLDEQLE